METALPPTRTGSRSSRNGAMHLAGRLTTAEISTDDDRGRARGRASFREECPPDKAAPIDSSNQIALAPRLKPKDYFNSEYESLI